jgi:hypothetical protein
VEVVEFLLFAFVSIYTGQRRVAAGFVNVQAALSRRLLPQHPQALPEEVLLFVALGLIVERRSLGYPPTKLCSLPLTSVSGFTSPFSQS